VLLYGVLILSVLILS